jgi:hypothetical protein
MISGPNPFSRRPISGALAGLAGCGKSLPIAPSRSRLGNVCVESERVTDLRRSTNGNPGAHSPTAFFSAASIRSFASVLCRGREHIRPKGSNQKL